MGCCASIHESTVGVVEQCGKFSRTSDAGCVCLNPFCCEKIAGRVSLRVQQLDVHVETKSKDNVFIVLVVSVQYRVVTTAIFDSYYKLTNPHDQITSFVFDVVRAEVPKITLDNIFVTKGQIAEAIKDQLSKLMAEVGFEILVTLITDIRPDEKVKAAMNNINAAERLKMAAMETAEANKIAIVKQAEAEAESKYLQGIGIARQRMAVVEGLRDSMTHFSSSIPGSTGKDVMDLVLITQYFDTMKEIGTKSGKNTIFLGHSPSNVADIAEQIRKGFLETQSDNAGGLVFKEVAREEEDDDKFHSISTSSSSGSKSKVKKTSKKGKEKET